MDVGRGIPVGRSLGLLLPRRSDNGQWCLPGGQLEPGESAAEGCAQP